MANEAQLSALITSGAIGSAVQLARQARYRSIQYQERARRIVADALIDPDAPMSPPRLNASGFLSP